ncbi:MAG: hypothetical protein ACHQ16_08580, partial [Candidatus Lutacidiplasmatales archaeon]
GIFNLPGAVARHLGIQTAVRPDSEVRGTDDQIVWFLPAPEYYEFRGMQRLGRPWVGPSTGGYAHVYIRRALLPMEPDLARLESEIRADEWRPRLEALTHTSRGRKALR